MRTTLDLKEELVKKARSLTKIDKKTALIHAGLEALIEKYARLRLAAAGGTDRSAKAARRRR